MHRKLTCLLALLSHAAPVWAVQYATTRVNTTITEDGTATKTELVQLIEPVLNSAGWTTASGTGTGDVVLYSATHRGVNVYMRVWDSAGTNCIGVRMQDSSATITGQTMFLLPANNQSWRIIANEYQFFLIASGARGTARKFASGGIPYVPSSLTMPSSVWWSNGNGGSDTDTVLRNNWLRSLYWADATQNSGPMSCNWDGNVYNSAGSTTAQPGEGTLFVLAQPHNSYYNTWNPIFADSSIMVGDALFGCTVTGVVASQYPRIYGLIWDGIVLAAPYAASGDVTITFDSKSFFVMTVQSDNTTAVQGQFAVRVP